MRPADTVRFTHDGDLDCEVQIELHVRDLVLRAKAAGWKEEEVANALLSCIHKMILKLDEGALLSCENVPPTMIQ